MRLVVLLLACGATGCGGVPAFAGSTFESDNEGWTLSNNGDLTTPTLMREGGNPGGHICGQDEGDGDVWYFVAPQRYLGNASATFGKRLTFDLKQGSIFNQVRGRDVILNGGGLAVRWNLRFAPGLDWTPYSARLDADSGWRIDEPSDQGPPVTEDELRLVLGDLRSLRIRGEYVDGPDSACLDNVYFGRD